ncbi:MAG: arylsulfatase, partial [Caulobacterales bacterium]|nr:arylsulfatase [Caulobacterales bacterium]
ASPTCSPTRAALLTGVDPHKAGLGNMAEDMAPNQAGRPGYEGYLNFDVVTVARLFQDAGYDTFMSGKWHLGLEAFNAPSERGFDDAFASLQGGAGHFADRTPLLGETPALYRENGALVEALPDDFYSTAYLATRTIANISESLERDRPFFAYLAFTAPHWPLQAPEDSVDRYDGVYDAGYEALYEARLAAAVAKGLAPADAAGSPLYPGQRPWADLSADERAYEARRMQIYAAMIDDLDRHLGRVIDHLRNAGALEDTIIIFLSDNGAEGHDFETEWPELMEHAAKYDNSFDNMGRADSYIWQGPNWGRASTAPFRLFKGYPTEGGKRVPLIIRTGENALAGAVAHAPAGVKDIAPTLLELAGLAHPGARYDGRTIHPMTGRSLAPLLRGETDAVHAPDAVFADELMAKRSVLRGDWKAVHLPPPHGTGDWQLYHLATDVSETRDLAAERPDVLAELVAAWDVYAEENAVILPDWVSGY